MQIESKAFFASLEANIEKELHGIIAKADLSPCDDLYLYGIDSAITEFAVHLLPVASSNMLGNFECAIIGAVTEKRAATTICTISCDCDNAIDLGKIMIAFNRALADTAASFGF